MPNELLKRLRAGQLTLLVERRGRLAFASDRAGLKPLYRGIVEHPETFEGSDVADKVVGLAAALLLAHARVARVVAGVISKEAEAYLDEVGIAYEGETRVKKLDDPVLQPEGMGLEQMARAAGTPARFIETVRGRLGS